MVQSWTFTGLCIVTVDASTSMCTTTIIIMDQIATVTIQSKAIVTITITTMSTPRLSMRARFC